jgi:hypothetical protein
MIADPYEASSPEQTTKPTYVEEEEKAKVSFQAQWLWLKEFIEQNPSMIKVGEMELRSANGRLKEAYQAWTRNTILPVAHIWRKVLPQGTNSSRRMKSWVENLPSNRQRTRRGPVTGKRFRQQPTAVTDAPGPAVMEFRVRRGKQKNALKGHLTRHFLQASLNRENARQLPQQLMHGHNEVAHDIDRYLASELTPLAVYLQIGERKCTTIAYICFIIAHITNCSSLLYQVLAQLH